VSNFAYASLLGFFSQGPGVRRRMHEQGLPAETLHGPLLLQAPYPDVLVARAVNDGGVLSGVLKPGRALAVGATYALELGQLLPGKRYRCEGLCDPDFIADERGEARVWVKLAERQSFRVSPAD
jgi:hypothetical protein